MRHQHPIILLTLALATLAGCGSTTTSNSSTSNQTTASKSGTSVANPSATTGTAKQGSASSASASTAAGAQAAASPTFPNGQPMQLTAEEAAAYSRGEYLAATDKHPALNVPVPVMPEVAKTKTAEGAAAFVQYWTESTNYAIQTGDGSVLTPVIVNYKGTEYSDLLNNLKSIYLQGQWISGSTFTNTPDPSTYKEMPNANFEIRVAISRTSGELFDNNQKLVEKFDERKNNGKYSFLELHWANNTWTVIDTYGDPNESYSR